MSACGIGEGTHYACECVLKRQAASDAALRALVEAAEALVSIDESPMLYPAFSGEKRRRMAAALAKLKATAASARSALPGDPTP